MKPCGHKTISTACHECYEEAIARRDYYSDCLKRQSVQLHDLLAERDRLCAALRDLRGRLAKKWVDDVILIRHGIDPEAL